MFGIGWGVPCCHATQKSGIGNRKETENQNRESTNQRKQVLQIQCMWKITVQTFASKNKRTSSKSPQTKISCLLKFV